MNIDIPLKRGGLAFQLRPQSLRIEVRAGLSPISQVLPNFIIYLPTELAEIVQLQLLYRYKNITS